MQARSFEYRERERERERETAREQKLFQNYREAVDRSVIVSKTDKCGFITYANEKFCKISGYTAEELIGRPHNIIRHPDMPQEVFKGLWETILNGQSWEGVVKNRNKNGSSYWVHTVINPIFDIDGNISEFIAIRHDVTELEEYKLFLKHELDTTSKNLEEKVHYTAQYEEAINSTTAILKTSTNNIITYANERFAIVAYTHYEKYDGSGYPRGLKGEDIPIYGRITAIADVFDALGHNRVYKKAWDMEDILDLFRTERAKHIDPKMVDLFFEHLDQFLSIRENMQD
ncbi:PAS domain S-box protein [Sulfuricurvum sp.]|uniref:PAS domain S-box protein n=1 Tax=Sulfuricurvum sp. TaxID=2025608 RepID=UPI00356B175D